MATIFQSLSNNFIALCADKRRTDSTGAVKDDMTKIEKWSPSVAVGISGNLTMGEYIRSSVHRYMAETGIENFGAEETAELIIQSYTSKIGAESELSSLVTRFVIAGKLSDKKLGAIIVKVSSGTFEKEVYEADKVPATLILEPDDLSANECNELLAKALKNVEGKYLKNPLESIHRRAVRNVSEQSNFVSKDSDFLLITP